MIKKLKNYIPLLIVLVLAVVIGVLLLTDKLDAKTLIVTVQDNKPIALLVIMALYVIKGLSMLFPVAAILIGTSVVFDLPSAIVISLIGNAICVSISYFMGRASKELTFDGYMEKYPKFKKYFSNAQKNNFVFSFVVHTSHLSMEAQGILFGLIRTPYLAYLAGTMLALLPSTMYYLIFGNDFDLTRPGLWVFIGLDVLTVIIGILIGKKTIIDGNKKTDSPK